MASRRKSTASPPAQAPPLSPAVSSTFRQTLLWRLENPLYAQALDTVGELLWEHVDQTHQFGPQEETQLMVSELRAAAGELRYAAGYLQDLANERTFCDLTPEETKLAGKAEKWSRKVLSLAETIEQATAE